MQAFIVLAIGVLFPLLGLGLFVGGIVAAIRQRRKIAASDSTTGTVVELHREMYNPGSTGIYCPVVEFTTPAGQLIRFQSSHGSRPAMHKVGQSVTVRYNPNDPQQAEIDSTLSNWFVPGCMVVLGAFFMLMGCMSAFLYLLVAPSLS